MFERKSKENNLINSQALSFYFTKIFQSGCQILMKQNKIKTQTICRQIFRAGIDAFIKKLEFADCDIFTLKTMKKDNKKDENLSLKKATNIVRALMYVVNVYFTYSK